MMDDKGFSKLDFDLYEILCLEEDCAKEQILKAYRKQALKWHPDKNPDNPYAVEQFLKVSKALELLTDVAARRAYDRLRRAKKAAHERRHHLDAKRRKLREDLEARERKASVRLESEVSAREDLQREVERLRREGSELLRREQEAVERAIKEERERLVRLVTDSTATAAKTVSATNNHTPAQLKVKWKDVENVRDEDLRKHFSLYGKVVCIVMSMKRKHRKKGSALIEFSSVEEAKRAVGAEGENSDSPFSVSDLTQERRHEDIQSDNPSSQSDPCNEVLKVDATDSLDAQPSRDASSFDSPFASYGSFPATKKPPINTSLDSGLINERDFESVVLMKLRREEERKRLIAQMKAEDETNS